MENKLQVYLEKPKNEQEESQIRLEGLLCKEYFMVRQLIY